MTVIAAAYDGEGNAYIAADSRANNNGTCIDTVDKIARYGDWAVGSAGSARTTGLIHKYAEHLLRDLDGAWDFSHRVRQVMADDGYAPDCNSDYVPDYGQQFVLANKGGVWSIGVSLCVIPIDSNVVWADGSGRAYAIGAGAVYNGPLCDRVRAAVGAAIHWEADCGGSIQMEYL